METYLSHLKYPIRSEDEDEVCAVCHEVEKGGSEMLECGRCLRGFHLCCLDPPLSAVPEVSGQACCLRNTVAEGACAWIFELHFAAMPFTHGAVFNFEL